MNYLKQVARLIQERIVKLSDAPEHTLFFYKDDFEYEEKGVKKWLMQDTAPALFNAIIDRLSQIEDWTVENIETAIRNAGSGLGLEGGKVIHPTRMAVTGRTWGPGLFELMQVLGREKCISRLKKAAEMKF